MISVLIADKNYLSRFGLFTLLSESVNFEVNHTDEESFDQLLVSIKQHKPKILVLDFQSLQFSNKQIAIILHTFKKIQILAITNFLPRLEMQAALNAGIRSYVLKECGKDEIIEALHATYNGERFLCGQVAHYLTQSDLTSYNSIASVSCEGIGITDREMEVVRLIAEGLSNKLIADKLELSTHTVNTHRKNLMTKLNIQNTAGIVMFAVKNNLLVA